MKLTKTLAALCVMGGALLAFSACKDSSGDGNIASIGFPKKWAISMTLDSTGDNIKVGDKAIKDSNNEEDTGTIGPDTEEGKTTVTGHELERQRCGKRYFEEFTGGFNNNEGFRMNIVLRKDGTWQNSEVQTALGTPRKATAGVLFDFYQYGSSPKTYDFFSLAFQATTTSNAISGVKAFFERYSGVKKTKAGIYSNHGAASALGSSYIPTNSTGSWDGTLHPASAGLSYSKTLTLNTDYYLDDDGNAIIGVDIKQLAHGIYTVKVGKITYTVGSETQTLQVRTKNFNQSWKSNFAAGQTIGIGGEDGNGSSITGYTNWTHINKNDKSTNLKGGVLVYAFAPYETKPIINYYICSTSKSSGSTDTTDSQVDYVGDWNVANELDVDGVETKVFYEEGNVVHKYIYY